MVPLLTLMTIGTRLLGITYCHSMTRQTNTLKGNKLRDRRALSPSSCSVVLGADDCIGCLGLFDDRWLPR